MTLMLEQVRECLARNAEPCRADPHPPRDHTHAPRAAAVLVPMLEHGGNCHLLFIRRAENSGDYHSGQVAFPGGCVERGDADLKATALRETYEEIGLGSDRVNVIGRLPHLISTTNYRITPFVGLIPWPCSLRLAPSEVARAFTIPLTWLLDPNNREACEHAAPSGMVSVIRFRPYAGEVLWGATARITVNLIRILHADDV